MIVENAAALRFLLTDEIYLLGLDRGILTGPSAANMAIETEPVLPPQTDDTAQNLPVPHFQFLGDNQKQFLIAGHYPDHEHMDDKHQDALKSALQRKELNLNDVAILNLAKHPQISAEAVLIHFKPSRLLILGEDSRLPNWESLELNQLTELNGIKTLYTYSFSQMLGDRDKTKAFWEQMKIL